MEQLEINQVIATVELDFPDEKKTIKMELKEGRLIQNCKEDRAVIIELHNGNSYTGIYKGFDDDDYTIMLESLSGKSRIGLQQAWIKNYLEEIPGKTVLRPQHDSRRVNDRRWKIARKTDAKGGGWARFGVEWYLSKEEAEAAIDKVVSAFPDEYEKEV